MAAREAYFDNAKFVLIFFVILGHLGEPVLWFRTAYSIIYSFHMPAFILISGYLAGHGRSVTWDRILIRTLLPYGLFQVLYITFSRMVLGSGRAFTLLTPYWIMWFLLSLAGWRLLAPVFSRMRYPVATALVVAVLAGYVHKVGALLSLSRTFTFFPFFLLGFRLQRSHVETLTRPLARSLSALVLLGVIGVNFIHPLEARWLYGSTPYVLVGHPEWSAGGIRLVYLLFQGIAATAVLALIPRRATFFTDFGSRTMYAYLLHGFVVRWAGAVGVYPKTWELVSKVSLILAAGLLTILLCSRPVQRVTWPLVEPWRVRRP